MSGPTDDELNSLISAVNLHSGNVAETARVLNMSRTTLRKRLDQANKRGLTTLRGKVGEHIIDEPPKIEYPDFPSDDVPVNEIIQTMKKRFARRYENKRAKRWFPVKINMHGPVGISFFGDPHVDNNGCNWDLLHHHCELHRTTEGLFGVNIGDTTDNWVGRLGRLYADSDTSKHTARLLADWFLKESGVTWACWLLGNHDSWNEGDAILKGMNAASVPLEDWQAQFRVVLPKIECRVWAAHQFPGNSMWNSLHGLNRAAQMKDWAHIYVAGHTHNWAIHQEESASKEFVYWLCRSRGYKFIDEYAERLGHASQQEGASVTAIIDPEASTLSGFVQCYADMDEAVEFLKWKRRKN